MHTDSLHSGIAKPGTRMCVEYCGGELPTARAVSTLLSPDVNIPSPGLSHMITTFGQLLAHDIRYLLTVLK